MFYVYELIDPRINQVFYVGKGSGNRCNFHASEVRKGRATNNPHKDRKIRQILNEGFEVIVRITAQTADEEEAYRIEEELQLFHGIANLTNICLGARPPRPDISPQRRQAMRDAMVGNQINRGRVHSEIEKTKRAESLRESYANGSRVVSDKVRITTANTHRGKTVSVETRAKIAESRRGKTLAELFGPERADARIEELRNQARSTIGKRAKEELTGKTYEEIYGSARAMEVKRKQREWSKQNKGKPITVEGVLYHSVIAASEATGLSPYLLRKLRDADR